MEVWGQKLGWSEGKTLLFLEPPRQKACAVNKQDGTQFQLGRGTDELGKDGVF